MDHKPVMQRSKCWASSLGDCDGGISREHLLSRSQFSGNIVVVQGFPGCREKPRTIGLNNLTAKILCRKHNTALSSVDGEAKKLLDALKEIDKRQEKLQGGRTRLLCRAVRISGDEIERWLLKTAIALTFSPKIPESYPGDRYTNIAFGIDKFAKAEGLYWVAAMGESVNRIGRLEFAPWRRKGDNKLVATVLRFHGHRLWLALDGAPEIKDAMHPIRRIDVSNLNMSIQFDWSPARDQHFAATLSRSSL